MPKQKELPELTKAEFDILKILWKKGRLTVREVHDQVKGLNRWAYSTTKTIMDRMAKKNLLKRVKFHGVFLYKPLISRPLGLARMIQYFSGRVLETDTGSIVSMFARNNTLDPEEIKELEKILEEDKNRDK